MGKPKQLTNAIGTGSYEVRRGDCVSSVAEASGHSWTTIWNHPENADLRKTRDPHVLLPGDRLFIPPLRPRIEQAATDQRHKYVRKFSPAVLRLVVKDLDEPLASQPYELIVDGRSHKGVTDASGRLEHPIPPTARAGRLFVGEGEDVLEYEFDLGDLDPIDTVRGVQARLANLGYDPGPIDGVCGPRTSDAIRNFCADQALDDDDGVITEEFCARLAELHGF